MAKRRRHVSLRWSLLRSFVLIILMSSLIVLVLTWVRSLETERQLSQRLPQLKHLQQPFRLVLYSLMETQNTV